ncbi:MAG: hypothetical protein Q9217_004934 [Psora testacea]
MVELKRGPYSIERSPPIPVPLEIQPRIFRTSNVITWFLWLFYTILQHIIAHSVQRHVPNISWQMWIALFAEFSAAQDYPTKCFRVFVLDDGKDEGLRKAVESIAPNFKSRRFAQTRYLSRTVRSGVKSYFKAGNLNFGIDETRRFGPSQYIAGLDADMIPASDWLSQMVPHLILEDKVGLAIPPQRYYNVPPGDPLGQQADFSMYFTVQEILNDYLDSSMCTGTGYVARRSALTDIGGWPLAERGEDFMCSALLSNAGWKVAFVRENLQYGLCPDSMRALVKQRMRWTDAGIEVHQQFGFYVKSSGIAAQMTWSQRAVNLLYAFKDYAPVTNVLAYRCIISLLPSSFDTPTFIVCGAIPANERSRTRRKPLLYRICSYDMLMYILYIIYASTPLFLCFCTSADEGHTIMAFFPFPGAIVKLASSILKTTLPVRYTLWPPTLPERRRLVEEDEKGVRRPKKEWKEGQAGEWLGWALVTMCELVVFFWCGGL